MVTTEATTDGIGRAPYVWAASLVAVWALVVIVIVTAASGEDPSVEAGTVVFLLPLAAFGVNVLAGIRGRPLGWVTRFAIATGVGLGIAYTLVLLVRWEPGGLYLVPILAFVAGAVVWIVSGGGWVLGAVVRSGLGHGAAEPDDASLDPDRL